MTEPASPQVAAHVDRPARARTAVRFGAAFFLLAAVGLGALVTVGYGWARDMRGGATAEVVTDPAAPGYLATVDPTPVHLLAITGADDELSAFWVVVPSASGGGSVIWSLGELIVQIDGKDTTFAQLYAGEGLDAARRELEAVLGFGAVDATVVGPRELAAIAEPVAPLEVDNPDPVRVEEKGKRVERFASGTISLEADELSDYLTVRAVGEAPENRSTRADALISALTTALGAESSPNGGSVVSSDAGVDVAEVLRGLGTGRVDTIVLPTTRQSFKGSYIYRPDPEGIAADLGDVVRFPVSAFPGQRPRVRVLNGTSDTSRANSIAPDLAAAGGEVVVIGNTDAFDATATTVVYSDASFEAVASRIATLLGVTAQRSSEPSDAADIDVVLGPEASS